MSDQDEAIPADSDSSTTQPAELAEPIDSRFLFVDVAAQRANQLRRGARVRLDGAESRRDLPHKLERVAMEEVRHRLVQYRLPQPPKSSK